MAGNWREYQEEAAAFFRSLGLDAETDVSLNGIRTQHAIDVVVRMHHVGFEVLWLVECKHWQAKVSKLHVIGLRGIVSELGADRGIILSEAGFQSGALEAATLTNVRATSLASLRETASVDIFAMRLREAFDRTAICKERYWDIPKDARIRLGLRDEGPGYSGARVVECAEEVLAKALRGVYPFDHESLYGHAMLGGTRIFASAQEVLDFVEPMLADLEKRFPSEGTL
jgi:restriction system protein